MTTIPVAGARANLSRIVERAESTHERFEITRNGERAAVLLGADDYDALLETVSVLADSELVRELSQSLAELDSGRSHSEDDVRAAMKASGRT
jgi:prevent-host-death family protein